MENVKKKSTLIPVIVLVVCIFLSLFALRPFLQSDRAKSYSLDYLDKKEKTVLTITAASATTSVVLAALPSDATTPVAEKMADVTGYMAGVLVIVYLEKYLVSVIGTFASTLLIPVSLGLLIVYLLFRKRWMKSLGIRILLLSGLLLCIVPLSVAFSKSVENAYQDNLTKATEAIQITDDSAEKKNDKKSEKASDSKSSKNPIEIIENTLSNAKENVADAAESVKDSASAAAEKVVNASRNFVELVAIMVLTSFLVPIITFILLLWAAKLIFNVSAGGPEDEYKQLAAKMNEIELKIKN